MSSGATSLSGQSVSCMGQVYAIQTMSQIHSPWQGGGGDKVDSGVGLTNRPAQVHRLAGRYDNPMPELNILYPQVIMNLGTV